MYLKNKNIESMAGSEKKKLIKVLSDLLFTNCQENISEKMKSKDLAFDYIDRLYYSRLIITLHKVDFTQILLNG